MSTKRYLRIPGKQLIITERMVLNAIEATRSNAEAARWLGVSYNTYKKYANKYGLFEANKNQAGVGIKRNHLNSKFKLDDILNNKAKMQVFANTFNRYIIAGYDPNLALQGAQISLINNLPTKSTKPKK